MNRNSSYSTYFGKKETLFSEIISIYSLGEIKLYILTHVPNFYFKHKYKEKYVSFTILKRNCKY